MKKKIFEKNGLHYEKLDNGNFRILELSGVIQDFNDSLSKTDKIENLVYEMQRNLSEKMDIFLEGKEAYLPLDEKTDVCNRAMEQFKLDVLNLSPYKVLVYFDSIRGKRLQFQVGEYTASFSLSYTKFSDIFIAFVSEEFCSLLPQSLLKPLGKRSNVRGKVSFVMKFSDEHFILSFDSWKQKGGDDHVALWGQDFSQPNFIITDQFAMVIDNFHFYNYIDLLPNGYPVIRRCTDQEEYDTSKKQRAFFDGVRLMFREEFTTCSIDTDVIGEHYVVYSSDHSIIDGRLYHKLYLERYTTAEKSFDFKDNKVFFRGNEITPLGEFLPSKRTILQSGYVHYEYSEYVESNSKAKIVYVNPEYQWLIDFKEAFDKLVDVKVQHIGILSQSCVDIAVKGNPKAILIDWEDSEYDTYETLNFVKLLLKSEYSGHIFLHIGGADEGRMMVSWLHPRVHILTYPQIKNYSHRNIKNYRTIVNKLLYHPHKL